MFIVRFGRSFKQSRTKGRLLAPIKNIGSATNTARVNKIPDFSPFLTDIHVFALNLCKYKVKNSEKKFHFCTALLYKLSDRILQKVLIFYVVPVAQSV
jgi:hypothetical protein